MKLTAERREHAAGVYVLGTLRGPARGWVERRLRHDAALCAEVVAWQDHLARWVERLAPVAPRDEVWLALERRIVSPVPTPATRAAPTAVHSAPPSWSPTFEVAHAALRFWRSLAGGLIAASLALAIGLALVLRPPPASTHTAVFADAQGRPVWIIDARLPDGELSIRALPLAGPPPGRNYELWLLPAAGAPVSLGVLPAAGVSRVVLGPDLPSRLLTAAGIAVSLEPAGGSPTGQPTGPVVYQAVLVRTAAES